MFVVFAFKINVSIILKMIQLKYQLTKQNWPICELGTVISTFAFGPERLLGLSRKRPQIQV